MNRNIGILAFLFLGTTLTAFAQESQIFSHDNKQYQDALALYNSQQYQAAQSLFEQVRTSTSDEETEANSTYYAANAAIRLNQRGADKLMEDFVERYPTSIKRNSAYMDVADYYFETGKYPYALKWYKKVEQDAMSRKDRERFNFNMGYSYYTANRPDEAERFLSKVSNSPTYGAQAKYYLGYIAYEQDDYDAANDRFDQISDPEVLKEKLSYYQADLNFKLGNFEKAIEMAQDHMKKADRREKSELYKIIGESYFNLKRYQEAIPNLKQYKGKRGRFSNTDFYLLGYSYYQLNNFEVAIGQFNKIIGGTNAVAQNAYYHLAECYLKSGQKTEALNAFRNASQMDFSPEIAKDALLNYARLGYEVGNPYEPVPQVMTTYLERYPGDENEEELKNLLVDSFITSKNFLGAMELLENNRNYASAETYQKVAFYRGVELFVDNDYTEALDAFEKSLKDSPNAAFEIRALYWKAESQYRLNRFEDALTTFTEFQRKPDSKKVDEFKHLSYNLGYCHFKQKQYAAAIEAFNRASKSDGLDGAMKADALMRLGDSHFVTSDYRAALKAYQKASRGSGQEKDYASFQEAMCYGFLGQTDAKIEGLNNVVSTYNKSSLQDDALYELANTYVKSNQENKGLRTYDRLLSQFAKSKFAPQALLRQGLVHYNANRNEQALTKLKQVVNDYPKSQEAIQAVSTAKLVYVDLGRVSEYADWVRKIDIVEVTDSELDDASFEAADRKYIEGKTNLAIEAFEAYLSEFPNGVHSTQANFTLAQLYFSKDQKAKALPRYIEVAERGTSEYGEQALARVCEIYVGEEDYQNAVPFLERLEYTAEIPQNITFAQSNLMKGYYQRKDYESTIAYAEKVLQAANIDDRIKSDAQIMIARAAIETGNDDLAQSSFAEVKKIATGIIGAEAWYYDAYFKNRDRDHEASNVSVQKLVKDFSAYKEWGGKGLVIMAKNFYALEDAFQATYILESVMENFSEFPEIVAQARGELSIIKAREANTNSSIDPNGN